MGYRSEVAVVVRAKHKEALKGILLKHEWKLDEESWKENEALGQFNVAYVQWDPDYESVAEIEGFLRALPAEEFGFLRIGGNLEDVETIGSPWDFGLHVHREMKMPL